MRLKKTIYGLVQAPLSYFKLCKDVYAKVGLRQLDCDECVFVKCSQNIKGQPPLSVENIIESGAFMTMDTIPKDKRVYESCIYPVACIIIVMYVDNNGVRHNCHELLAEFQSGRHCPTTQEFSQLSHFLQQCGFQLESFPFFCTCYVICRS